LITGEVRGTYCEAPDRVRALDRTMLGKIIVGQNPTASTANKFIPVSHGIDELTNLILKGT
jgi:hypothetical protein